MDKQGALEWFLRRREMGLQDKCQQAEDIAIEAIENMIAKEPRVMTLDEARSAFVIEYRSGKLKEVGMTILDIDVDSANAQYGVIYRVWTSRPTDEQSEATPWG